VLYREIRERGYAGGLTQLKMYLAPLKRVAPEPVVRFETEPGEQLQADFTHVRRGRDPLLAFVATLGYSRASFVHFTEREDAATLCRCLREALMYFGGVPGHVLLDNASTMVIERDAYGAGAHRFHRDLLTLSQEFGFRVRLCRPYRAKTKGKVERFNSYLKSSFLVPLAATLKQSGLNRTESAASGMYRDTSLFYLPAAQNYLVWLFETCESQGAIKTRDPSGNIRTHYGTRDLDIANFVALDDDRFGRVAIYVFQYGSQWRHPKREATVLPRGRSRDVRYGHRRFYFTLCHDRLLPGIDPDRN
jgi:hypothetical protein